MGQGGGVGAQRWQRSLSELLDAQSPAMQKLPLFLRLRSLLRASQALRRLRLNRRAYRLLNEPRLEPANLDNFYATYRIQKSPFFEIFLKLKWERRAGLATKAKTRRSQIVQLMASCPSPVRGFLAYLEAVESSVNPGHPLFDKLLYPSSKKRARELSLLTLSEWLPRFEAYFASFRRIYRSRGLLPSDCLLASMILECLPDPRYDSLPKHSEIKAAFRRLSKESHPDAGGEGDSFLLLKRARDILLAN